MRCRPPMTPLAAMLEETTADGRVWALIRDACVIEAQAVKAGNVHPHASFADTTFDDFVRSAGIIAACWSAAPQASVGQWIYSAVREVRYAIGRNTNLGIILLLAPLTKAAYLAVSRGLLGPLLPSHEVLGGLDASDAADVYRGIALAAPGGLGDSDRDDVRGPPPDDLLRAMAAAAGYDDVARQYVTNFADVYTLAGRLVELCGAGQSLLAAVPRLQIEWLATRLDSLIVRKCGIGTAREVLQAAAAVLGSGPAGSAAYDAAWRRFDDQLRSDGNRLNPGTTADLLAAAIFVYLFQSSDHVPHPDHVPHFPQADGQHGPTAVPR